jgi:hypothetical protein
MATTAQELATLKQSQAQETKIEVKEQEEIERVEKKEEKERGKSRYRRILKNIETQTSRIVSITEELPSVFLQNLPLITIVVSVGIGMIVLRFVIMISCPEIARHARQYAHVINFLFGIVSDAFELITIKNAINVLGFFVDSEGSIIRTAQETITTALPYALGIAHWHNLFTGVNWHMFSTTDIQEFFSKLPVECAKFDNIETVFLFPVKAAASPAVCPIIRYRMLCGLIFSQAKQN